MALTRNLLKSLQLPEDQIQTIIEAHSESVDYWKGENARLTKELESKADYDEIKASISGSNEWKDKYNTLEKEYTNYKNGIESERVLNEKVDAYKAKLQEANIDTKKINTILKCTDISNVNMEEVTTESIQEEWADFVVQEHIETPKVLHPIDGMDGISVEQFRSMSYNERAQLYTENRALYDELTRR